MRIIAGQFRSRLLRSLSGLEVRPTSDRLRETLFDVLTGGSPSSLEGSVWVDLFAGSGAVGIEALSRGAAKVYFVDSLKAAVELIRRNLETLAVTGKFEIINESVRRALSGSQLRAVKPDFIFLDPPYALGKSYRETLTALAGSHLSEASLVIVEHARKFDPGEKFQNLERIRRLHQGGAALSFYRRAV
jgi:16S rRNA (guanine966-N2)-methyltransferase